MSIAGSLEDESVGPTALPLYGSRELKPVSVCMRSGESAICVLWTSAERLAGVAGSTRTFFHKPPEEYDLRPIRPCSRTIVFVHGHHGLLLAFRIDG